MSIGLLVKWAGEAQTPAAGTAQAPAPSTVPAPAAPLSEPGPPPAVTEPALFATDDRGFVNSSARCDGTQTAVAMGRTEGSLVVICLDQTGRFDYRGVRLSDDAVLKAAAQTTPAHVFVARNDNVIYAVSPTELRVTAGETVIKHEPMIEYREPRA